MSNAPYSYEITNSYSTLLGQIQRVDINYPAFPGVWFINFQQFYFPIFTSLSSYIDSYTNWINNNTGFNDLDNQYIVMTGFKLIVYQDINYGSSNTTFDNTDGNRPLYGDTSYMDRGSSCKLYFNGNLIDEPPA